MKFKVKSILINLKVDFAALCIHEIYTLLREIPMQVTLSGYTGRAASVSNVPRRDDSGFFQIAEAPLAVRVAEDTTDWYLLKFKGDSLVTAANYIKKGSQLSITGKLSFEDWNDPDGVRHSKPVVDVYEVQLERKPVAV